MASKGPNDLQMPQGCRGHHAADFPPGDPHTAPPDTLGGAGGPWVWGASGHVCCSRLAVTLENPLCNSQNFVISPY